MQIIAGLMFSTVYSSVYPSQESCSIEVDTLALTRPVEFARR